MENVVTDSRVSPEAGGSLAIDRCPVCQNRALACVLKRRGVPVFQNSICRSEAAARAVATGDIVLMVCEECGYCFNGAFDPTRVDYGPDYENDQSHSGIFLNHMDAIADRVLAALPPRGGTVVEIGCGQGGFLSHLAHRAGSRAVSLYGFDPSYRAASQRPGITISARVLDEGAIAETATPPDVLVSRHVIEHVADPVAFLSTIRSAVKSTSDITLFLETPSFEWIAKNRVVFDVFYEHVNYFTAFSLTLALEMAGFAVRKVEHVFDGQYLWAEASAVGKRGSRPVNGTATAIAARKYAGSIEEQLGRWRDVLTQDVPTALWGAGAKGMTFAGLVDFDRKWIDCLIDINPAKQGKFVPVTAHPIVSPQDAAKRGVRRVVVMNPNYLPEIRAHVAAQGWSVDLVEAGSPAK